MDMIQKILLINILFFCFQLSFAQSTLEFVGRYEYQSDEVPRDFIVHNDYGYLASGKDGLKVLDFSNMDSIQEVYTYKEFKIRARKKKYGTAERVTIFKNQLYLAYGDLGFKLFNLEKPDTIEEIGGYFLHKYIYSVTPSEDFVILGLPNGIKLIDCSNSEKMEMLSIKNFKEFPVRTAKIKGNNIFVTGNLKGINVCEFKPANYKFWSAASKYDTKGITDRMLLEGNNMYVANGAAGLQVLDVKLAKYPAVAGVVETKEKVLDIYKYGTKIYAAAEDMIYVFDVADPTNPILESEFENKDLEYRTIWIDKNYLYVTFEGRKDLRGVEVYKLF